MKMTVQNKNQNRKKISSQELKSHPEIYLAFQKDKSLKYEFLNFMKPKSISTRNIRNEKKKKFVESLNSFRNIFYDFSNIKKQSLKEMKKIKKENSRFEKLYNEYKKKSSYNYSELLSEYEKKKFFFKKLPKENLFKENILFLNNSQLKKKVKFSLMNENEEKKTIKFLTKIQKQIYSLRLKDSNNKQNISKLYIKKVNSVPCMKNKNSIKEIKKDKKNISETKKTFQHLLELDKFFEKKNSEYFINSYKTKESSEKINYEKNQKDRTMNKLNLKKMFLKQNIENNLDKLKENEKNTFKQFIKIFPLNLIHGNLNKKTKNKLHLLFHHPVEKLYNQVSKES